MPALPAILTEFGAEALFWPPSRLGAGSAWYGHVPFAHWLVAAIRPPVVVELGTHNGVSFAAFCEAARRTLLPSRCIAVDLWHGDAHAGFYGEEVYRDLAAFIARTYPAQTFPASSFPISATLRRSSFADALPDFAPASIHLLHIDGRHRYEDVCEDYQSWRPKLAPGAVVLFHDICEHQPDFGVHRCWAELGAHAPHFSFPHAHGLGVLLPDGTGPQAVESLCALQHTQAGNTLRARCAALGERWVADMRAREGEIAQRTLRAHVHRLQTHIDELATYTQALQAAQAPPAAAAPRPLAAGPDHHAH